MKKLFLAVFLLAGLNAVTLNPTLSPKKCTVGDPVKYTIKFPKMNFVPKLELNFQNTANTDVLLVTQSMKLSGEKYQYQAVIVPFKTGRIIFPTANFAGLYVKSVFVSVNSVIGKTTTVNLQPEYGLYSDWSDVYLLLILLGVGLAGYRLWLKYRPGETVKVLSLEEKNDLWRETLDYFASTEFPNELKPYYFTASEKLKEFADKILGLPIQELTSSEIAVYLNLNKIAGQNEFMEVLYQADYVKFAKYIPGVLEHKDFVLKARAFLERHKPVEKTNG